MILLLDTHVWLWLFDAPERLGRNASQALRTSSTDVLLSAASVWEVAIKHALGRLPLTVPLNVLVADSRVEAGLTPLPISHAHALGILKLPPHHADPFDRLLIAQARAESATIVTIDPAFRRYDVNVMWAAD